VMPLTSLSTERRSTPPPAAPRAPAPERPGAPPATAARPSVPAAQPPATAPVLRESAPPPAAAASAVPPAAPEQRVAAPPARPAPEPARRARDPRQELALPFDASLETILYSPERRLALVDGRIVQIGDVVRGARITEITETTVLLRDASNRLRSIALGDRR